MKTKTLFYWLGALMLLTTSCKKNKRPDSVHIGKNSTATGIAYNAKEGFSTPKSFKGQPTGPNLVYIEGG
ncbi:hypothetical protein BWI93_22535, partial [Siphonobacter sp. BAB-5385]